MRRILAILVASFLLLTVVSVAQAPINQGPVADPNGPYTGTVGVPLTFDGSGSSDPDGDPLTYHWDFGNGDTDLGVNPTYTYAAAGVYTVTLWVTDPHGLAYVQPTTATISLSPPVASFTESTHVAPVGTPIDFDPSGSLDPDGTIVLYEWILGVEPPVYATSATPQILQYIFLTPGTYTVTLTVTDNDGLTDTATDTKTITPLGVIPEVPLGTIIAASAMIIALVAYVAAPKFHKKPIAINA